MQINDIFFGFVGVAIGATAMLLGNITQRLPPAINVARRQGTVSAVRALIWGAGALGDIVYNQLLNCQSHQVDIVGYVDDDKNKVGKLLNGVRVLGSSSELRTILKKRHVHIVVQAFSKPVDHAESELFSRRVSDAVSACEATGVLLLDPTVHYLRAEAVYASAYNKFASERSAA